MEPEDGGVGRMFMMDKYVTLSVALRLASLCSKSAHRIKHVPDDTKHEPGGQQLVQCNLYIIYNSEYENHPSSLIIGFYRD